MYALNPLKLLEHMDHAKGTENVYVCMGDHVLRMVRKRCLFGVWSVEQTVSTTAVSCYIASYVLCYCYLASS